MTNYIIVEIMIAFINRGAQNVVSVVVWWCLWRVQRGPSGPVQGCVICSHCTLMVSYFFTIESGYKVALQLGWKSYVLV